MASLNKLSILTRLLSNAVALQKVKLPEQICGLEGRYATALYSVASILKQLDQVEKDLTALQATIKGNKKFHQYVTSPIMVKRVLSTDLQSAYKKYNLAPVTLNLLGLLANNGHLTKLDTIINAFKTIMATHRDVVVCKVVTAKPLDSLQTKQLQSALKPFLKNNQTLKITSCIDPSIFGGLIVSIGDKNFDMSIVNKVKFYTNVIRSAALIKGEKLSSNVRLRQNASSFV